jgi:hypothetical protein
MSILNYILYYTQYIETSKKVVNYLLCYRIKRKDKKKIEQIRNRVIWNGLFVMTLDYHLEFFLA